MYQDGKYTIVIGNNPRGLGKTKLGLWNGVVVKGMMQAANPTDNGQPTAIGYNGEGKSSNVL